MYHVTNCRVNLTRRYTYSELNSEGWTGQVGRQGAHVTESAEVFFKSELIDYLACSESRENDQYFKAEEIGGQHSHVLALLAVEFLSPLAILSKISLGVPETVPM